MTIHPWWSSLGHDVQHATALTPVLARELAVALADGVLPGAILTGLKQADDIQYAAVQFEVDVERPQDLAYPIRATEPIAALFPFNGAQPSVLALRADFPDTPHQNWSLTDAPCALCIDDRPWPEARLTVCPADLVRRIQLWLAKAARGELHDTAQPPDPLFFVSSLSLILPAAAVSNTGHPVELAGFGRADNPSIIIARSAEVTGAQPVGFMVLAFQAQPQTMTRLRRAPVTLEALAQELAACGINLYAELKARLKDWAGLKNDDIRRLSSRLAIVISFPITAAGRTANDCRAFMTHDSTGEIGISLGVLLKNVGAKAGYLPAIGETPDKRVLKIEPSQVHFAFDRDLAASIAGRSSADRRKAVLIGAGSLGSQLAINLTREGTFHWTITDRDYLLPHNLARHALGGDDVGAPKAFALARYLGSLLNEPAVALPCDVLSPDPAFQQQLSAAFKEAGIIIDASASVAVSRHVADMSDVSARRVCAFFNPAGTSIVLLTESADRSITLSDLEAQYHRLVQAAPALASHLRAEANGIRYSGSCRAITNRIPATRAALLSALAARGIDESIAVDRASLRIWNLNDDGQVELIAREGCAIERVSLGGWNITYDSGLLNVLAALRASKLPDETGGVLLGIVDISRRSIHIVHAMPEPEDSRGSQVGFERGVVGLYEQVTAAVEASMHQLRYVGEWHSHPDRSSALPSGTDITQLVWLRSELAAESLPGLMAIAAQDGRFAFIVADGYGAAS
jgi:proteasome lid subunit RPN8/RPN11